MTARAAEKPAAAPPPGNQRGQSDINPYQAPAVDAGQQSMVTGASIDPAMVKKFRDQIHALGAVWIILGGLVLVLLLAGLLLGSRRLAAVPGAAQIQLAVFAANCLLWVVLGIMTCLKQMWAVYVGLALCYISLLQFLLSINLCGIVILLIVILQAHRVIIWASRMRAAGVPLTTAVPA